MPSVIINAKVARINVNGLYFMSYANRYREAAATLRTTSKRDSRFDPVVYQLLCQSLELHLKSFIWLKDQIGDEQIKKRYRHDIAKLWADSKKMGIAEFSKVTPARDRAIQLLSPYYAGRKFCYLDIDMAFRGFKDLDRESKAVRTLMQLTKQLGTSLRDPILQASKG